jgi:molecular chaperone DnaJ
MEKINRAWFCLGDDDRRSRYDMYGEQGVGSSAASEEQLRNAGGPGFSGFGGMGGQTVDVQDISDIFDAFFGNAGARGGVRSGTRRSATGPVAGAPF